MSKLFTKLNLADRDRVVVLGEPPGFAAELAQLRGVDVSRSVGVAPEDAFLLAFVQDLPQVADVAATVSRLPGDPVVWLAYPKQSSKRYSCAFNRDTGWQALGDAGFEAVRQVAIDEDWSALRFRRTEHIKRLTRRQETRLSPAGRSRAS
jgi:hypothetical protein